MSTILAEWIVRVLAVYGLIGVVLAAPFVTIGIGKIDPLARETGIGFRLIVVPGVVALWPLLLRRWLSRGNAG